MIFSRGKAKPVDYTSELRQVEADTIRRWRNIAAGVECEDEPVQAVFSLGTESTFDSRQACSDPTITLIDEIVLPSTGGDYLSASSDFSDVSTGYQEDMQSTWSAGTSLEQSQAAFDDATLIRQAASYHTNSHAGSDRTGTDRFAGSESASVGREEYTSAPSGLRSAIETQYVADHDRRTETYTATDVFEKAEETVTPLKKVPPCDLNMPADEDLKRRFGNNIRSALGPGTVIEGTFSFDAPVCIDGTLNGEVRSSSALIVGAHANVTATVIVGSLIVLGRVTGPIQAEDLIEIRAGGALEGNIATKRLVVEDGGYFNGRCHHIE